MDYDLLMQQAQSLADEEPWFGSLLSNTAALLYESLPNLNWAGFYLIRNGRLTLGPFVGKVACIHIPLGKGVCGTAAIQDQTLVVPDVHTFPGHIACDSASASEIVIPFHQDGAVIGVMDIDSPLPDRFSEQDRVGLERIASLLETVLIVDGGVK